MKTRQLVNTMILFFGLVFLSVGVAYGGGPVVRGKLMYNDKIWGDRPANGVYVKLCTMERKCGEGAYTDSRGNYYLHKFPKGKVILEVYPKGKKKDFLIYEVFVGKDYWILDPIKIDR